MKRQDFFHSGLFLNVLFFRKTSSSLPFQHVRSIQRNAQTNIKILCLHSKQAYFFNNPFMFIMFYLLFLYFLIFVFFTGTANSSLVPGPLCSTWNTIHIFYLLVNMIILLRSRRRYQQSSVNNFRTECAMGLIEPILES